MDKEVLFKSTIILSILTGLTAATGTKTLPENLNLLIPLAAAISYLLVALAEKIAYKKGASNKNSFHLQNTKFISEILILTTLITLYTGFLPSTLYYLAIILTATLYITQSNKKRILGEKTDTKFKYKTRNSLLIATIILNTFIPVIGFYIFLIYIIITIYNLYQVLT